MKFPTVVLEKIETLHLLFRGYRSHDGFGNMFRGQADSSWNLLPKAGRKEFFLPNNRDLGRFNEWSRQAVAYCSLPTEPLEQLAIAQHHGFATRLLDWTKNPLVACFFACCEQPDKDGAVYVLEPTESTLNEKITIERLASFHGVFTYFPRSISPRLLNQRGIFTVHCDASCEIPIVKSRAIPSETSLFRVVIPAKLKSELLGHLEDYGIDRVTLFPDLDGLSAHANVKTKRILAKKT